MLEREELGAHDKTESEGGEAITSSTKHHGNYIHIPTE